MVERLKDKKGAKNAEDMFGRKIEEWTDWCKGLSKRKRVDWKDERVVGSQRGVKGWMGGWMEDKVIFDLGRGQPKSDRGVCRQDRKLKAETTGLHKEVKERNRDEGREDYCVKDRRGWRTSRFWKRHRWKREQRCVMKRHQRNCQSFCQYKL